MRDERHRAEAAGALAGSGFFALRAPALPFATLTEWAQGVQAPSAGEAELAEALAADRRLLRGRLDELVARPEIRGAIWVASPELVREVDEGNSGDPRVEATLVRYVSRMAARSTPFGLFAGCATGRIGDRTELRVPGLPTRRRHTRVDADHLDALVRATVDAPEARERIVVRPNATLAERAGRLRYVQSRIAGEGRTHHLVQVPATDQLRAALAAARDGARLADVAAALTSAGMARPAADRYAARLLDHQLLVADLALALTGAPPLDTLIDDLGDVDAATSAVLADVRDELAAVDADGVTAAPERHERALSLLEELGVPVKPGRTLQVDMTMGSAEPVLAAGVLDEIVRGVDLLRRLSPVFTETELDAFRSAFAERYEQREVPLLEALDEELGVGFRRDPTAGDPSPLLEGLKFPGAGQRERPVGAREQRLLELLHRALRSGSHEIALEREDLDVLGHDDPRPLPGALAAMATLAHTTEGRRVLVGGVSGPSGARLLGRFCHDDSDLTDAVREHLGAEEALEPDAVFAEVVHLPVGRIGNILARPLLRNHEIEWLGRSGAPAERRIGVDDLLVSIRDGRIVLRSRRLGRRVIPRMSTAHNWVGWGVSTYRFLCALQSEGVRGDLGWSWGPFDRAPFLPRVRVGRIVLARARWCVTAAELEALDVADPAARWRAVQDWRHERGLPRLVCQAEHDRVIPVDFDNVLSVDAFVRRVRGREEATLEEQFPAPDELIAEGPDGRYAHELVVPLVRTAPVAAEPAEAADVAAPAPPGPVGPGARRVYPPGSEWAYLRVYTGTATADRLLTERIGPLVAEIAPERWFFLRYTDPGYHLRVRLRGDADQVRAAVDRLATEALDAQLAHDASVGTYIREIERYGGPEAIDIAEEIFHADSDAVVEVLGMLEPGATGLDERWRMGLLGAERLMADLGLDAGQRARVAERMASSFAREMRADAALRRALGKRFRDERVSLAELLALDSDADHQLAPGVRALDRRSARIAEPVERLARLAAGGRLALPLEDLTISYVHMWLNRLMRSDNRRHEYVVYDLLARLHAARAFTAAEGSRPSPSGPGPPR